MTDQLVMNLAALAMTFSMLAALFDVARRVRAGKISNVPTDRALRPRAHYRWVRFVVGIMVGIVWMLAIVRWVQVHSPLIDHGLLHEQFARVIFLTTGSTTFWLLALGAEHTLFVIAAIVCTIMIFALTLALSGMVWSAC